MRQKSSFTQGEIGDKELTQIPKSICLVHVVELVFCRSPPFPLTQSGPIRRWTSSINLLNESERARKSYLYKKTSISSRVRVQFIHFTNNQYTLYQVSCTSPSLNSHVYFYNMAASSPVLRPLGKDGPLVPRIGFGTMGMGFPGSRLTTAMPDPERLALLDRAYELGCRFWDTSDIYVRSETLLLTLYGLPSLT